MDILIFALILLIIVGLMIYVLDLIPMDGRLKLAAKVLLVVIAIIMLCNRAGLL